MAKKLLQWLLYHRRLVADKMAKKLLQWLLYH